GPPGMAICSDWHTARSGNSSTTRTRNRYRNVPSDRLVVSRHATGSAPGKGSPSLTSTIPPVTEFALLKNASSFWNSPRSTFLGGTNARVTRNSRAASTKPAVKKTENVDRAQVAASDVSEACANSQVPQPKGSTLYSTRNRT